jgi:hypothetical protein
MSICSISNCLPTVLLEDLTLFLVVMLIPGRRNSEGESRVERIQLVQVYYPPCTNPLTRSIIRRIDAQFGSARLRSDCQAE